MEVRPKSFKTLNFALPLKRQIDDNLTKLQIEKRQLLALERQQTDLKERLEKLRRQYNELRQSEVGTKSKIDKTNQNTSLITSVDRAQQNTVNSLNQLKSAIQVKRRQVQKYKKLNQKLSNDFQKAQQKLGDLWQKVQYKEDQCERLKKQLIDYRSINHKNVAEFQKSHYKLTQSSFKQQNSRRKSAVVQSTFWGQELRQSKALPADKLSDTLKSSGVFYNESNRDIMTESVPLAKHRVALLIHANRDKLRISDNYRRFGEGLFQMFGVMKNYKGRDDLDFIAQEFVAKERQIQNLEQYVSTLEGNITMQRKRLDLGRRQDAQLERVLQTKNENEIEKQYQKMNEGLLQDIGKLQMQQDENTVWIQKVGQILKPLLRQGELFNGSNAMRLIGEIEERFHHKKQKSNPKEDSVGRNQSILPPNLDLPEGHNRGTNELLDYGKMKEFAEQFLKSKAN